MWSSSDLQGGYPTQWALNPSAYQNVANEEVDWASLAQQWIKMKETFPAEQVPPAPPPPPISTGLSTSMGSGASGGMMNLKGMNSVPSSSGLNSVDISPDIEGGEAPMDMDTKDDNDAPVPITNTSSASNSNNTDSAGWNSWNNWQQWGWGVGNNWPATGSGAAPVQPPGSTPAASGTKSNTSGSYAFNASNTTGSAPYNTETSNTFDYNHGGTSEFNQQGYWMGGGTSPYIRQKGAGNTEWRHDGRHLASGRVGRGPDEKSDEEEEAVPVIDAAKRKQLPAWIREGLEKMEKEKLKKQEKERMIKERELELVRQKELIQQQAEQSNQDPSVVPHSKFDSDSEDNSDEESHDTESELNPVAVVGGSRKSRFDQTNRPSTRTSPSPPAQLSLHANQPPPFPPVYRSKEEIMQDVMIEDAASCDGFKVSNNISCTLMIVDSPKHVQVDHKATDKMKKVRIVLTDILMSVTSEELDRAANEVLSSMRAKAPAKQLRKTPALTSLTGKLGLGIYDDSDASDASDDADDDDDNNDVDEYSRSRNNGVDSDEELKDRMQRRKQEFARIELDILTNIEEQEERERRQMLDDENDADDKDDESDIHHHHRNRHHHHHHRHEDDEQQHRGDDHQVEAKHSSGNKGDKRSAIIEHNSLMASSKYEDMSSSSVNQSESRLKRGGDSSQDQSEQSDDNNDDGDDDDDNDNNDNSSESSDSSSQSNSSRDSKSSRKRKKHSSSSKKSKDKKHAVDRRANSSSKSRTKRTRSRTRSRSRGSDRKHSSSLSSSHRKSSHDSYRRDDSRRRKDSHDSERRSDRDKERDRNRDRSSYKEHEHSRTRDRSRSRDHDRRHGDSYKYRRHTPSPHSRKHYYSSSSSSHKRRRRSSSSSDSARGSKRSNRDRDRDRRSRD